MPVAHQGEVKYAWQDHDPAYLNQIPVQNVWYTVAHVYDFRELLFAAKYDDDEHNFPTYEVRWTLDGNVYFGSFAEEDNLQLYVRKDKYPSNAGTTGLYYNTAMVGSYHLYDDKRGLDGLFQIRITNAVGTNPLLEAWLLYETLEQT